MSDGSLQWLAGDAPTTVEKVSTTGGARVIDGIIKSGFGFMSGKWSDYIAFSGNSTVETDFTISFWWKYNETPSAAILAEFGLFGSVGGYQWWISDHGTSGVKTKTHHGPVYFAGGDAQVSKDPNVDHPWVHYTITRTSSSTKFYVNGVFKYDHGAYTTFIPQNANAEFALGAIDSDGSLSKYDTLFEGFAITEGSALDAAGVQTMFDAGRPSQGASSQGASSMVGLEEDSNITLHGNAQLANGVLSFDGTSGTYASLPHSTDYDRESGDLTIYMWMKPNSLPSNWNAALVSKMGAGWSGYIAAISTMAADAGGNMTTGGLQTTTFGGGNSNNRAAPSGGIALNTWHHVAFVMPAVGDYKMYFNGQEVHSYSPTNRITGTSGDLKIGGWENGGYSGYFDGDIDGLFIKKSALAASDISDLHSAGRGATAPVLLTAHNGATIDASGLIQTNAGYVSGLWSDYVAFTGNNPTNADLTVSFWWKHGETPAPGNTPSFGLWSSYEGSNNGYMFYIEDHFSSGLKLKTHWGVAYFANRENMISEVAGVDHPWNHFVLTRKFNGQTKLYWQGVHVQSFAGHIPFVPNDANADFTIGATNDSGELSSKSTFFDKFQIIDGQCMTAAEVTALYNQGR